MSLQEFFHMGGYAFYVWSAYLVVGVVLAANLVYPLRRRRALLRQITKLSLPDVIDDSET
jgi:heme exporter protein D